MPSTQGVVVVDSGPLVALFDNSDDYHDRAVNFMKGFRGHAYTNLAILTEVMYLLDFSAGNQANFLDWIVRAGVNVMNVTIEELLRSKELILKYADLPMDFADATVVAMCERLGTPRIATIDRDFLIYRFNDKTPFENVFLRD